MALILVTGASSGLGLSTSTFLADRGHEIVLHARSPDRINDDTIRTQVRAVVYGDLADMEQTAALARRVNEIGRFDAVIHNAGVIDGPDVISVNVVAPYVLTAMMLPPGRIIVLSSVRHKTGNADLESVNLAPGSRRNPYDDSKLYVTALVMAIADQRPDALVHAVNPGWVPTRMGGRAATDDLEKGHLTQAWLATADASEIEPRTGGYWYHLRAEQPHPATLDATFQLRVLNELESQTGISL